MWAERNVGGLVVVLVLVCSSVVQSAAGDKAFVDGNSLLAKGDLNGALQAYASAVQADRANQQYSQQYLLLRQVIQLQNRLAGTTNGSQRVQLCQALRAFYGSHGLHDQALVMDQELFRRLKTGAAAVQLAETHLALDQTDAAVSVLSGLDAKQTTDATQAMLALALARQGQMSEAQRIAASIAVPANAGPDTLYAIARMHAALGNDQAALSTLRRCLESVPPSRLSDWKSRAKQCADFASLTASTGFQEVLQTSSKVVESACSGGSSCATCPMRGGCSNGRSR